MNHFEYRQRLLISKEINLFDETITLIFVGFLKTQWSCNNLLPTSVTMVPVYPNLFRFHFALVDIIMTRIP